MPYQHNRASGREKKTNKQTKTGAWLKVGRGTAQGYDPELEVVLCTSLNVLIEHWPHLIYTLQNKKKTWIKCQHEKTADILRRHHWFPRNDVWETSAEIPYWWRVTKQIWVIDWSCRFNQSEALNTQLWVVTRHKHGISALVSQTSLCVETSCGVTKCRLFSLAIQT